MHVSSRRTVAALAAAALVSGPAIALVGDGGAAHAGSTDGAVRTSSFAGGTPGASCRAATPAGLGGGLGSIVGGLLGDGGSSDPVSGLLDTLTTAVGSAGSSDPGTTLAGVLTGSGDPSQVIGDLTGLLSGSDTQDVQDLIEQLDELDPTDAATLVSTLTGALPIADVFPDGLPDEVAALLSGSSPTTVTELVDQLAAAYHAEGATEPPSSMQQALPQSLFDALRAALAKLAATPSPTAHPTTGSCVTPPVSTCRAAAAKVKTLKKRLRAARHHHHAAKAVSLAKRLHRAKRAKRRAC